MAPRKKGEGSLSGVQKAAVVMMTIQEDVAAKIFGMMTEEEIKEISHTMTTLGPIKTETVDSLMREFVEEMSQGANVVGSLENTEKLLTKILGKEKVATLMEDISGPAGRNTWDKLNNVGEDILSAYLKNEYPQTVALVLSKIRTSQAAKVLSVLPDDFALEVIQRMITIEPVKREVLASVEKALQSEFMSSLAASKKVDSFEAIAEVFNNFDRNTETKFMEMLDSKDPDSANKIKELMFTFDDLAIIAPAGIQALLRVVDKDKLAIALKGANDTMRDLFFKNMSERAAKILKEDMEGRGPVRMRDVDEAQMAIVVQAKELAASGELVIPDGEEEEEEMVN